MASCKEYEERAIDTAPHQQPGCALSWSTYDGTRQRRYAHVAPRGSVTRIPIWVRISGIIALVLVAIVVSSMLLGSSIGGGSGHGSGAETEMTDDIGSGSGHDSGGDHSGGPGAGGDHGSGSEHDTGGG
jgi:hypothetical protein